MWTTQVSLYAKISVSVEQNSWDIKLGNVRYSNRTRTDSGKALHLCAGGVSFESRPRHRTFLDNYLFSSVLQSGCTTVAWCSHTRFIQNRLTPVTHPFDTITCSLQITTPSSNKTKQTAIYLGCIMLIIIITYIRFELSIIYITGINKMI